MDAHAITPDEFWHTLEHDVTAKVEAALITGRSSPASLVSYLRDLEMLARTECDRRQTVQIIASGRSLLGDRAVLGPSDVPFANDVGLSEAATEMRRNG